MYRSLLLYKTSYKTTCDANIRSRKRKMKKNTGIFNDDHKVEINLSFYFLSTVDITHENKQNLKNVSVIMVTVINTIEND